MPKKGPKRKSIYLKRCEKFIAHIQNGKKGWYQVIPMWLWCSKTKSNVVAIRSLFQCPSCWGRIKDFICMIKIRGSCLHLLGNPHGDCSNRLDAKDKRKCVNILFINE